MNRKPFTDPEIKKWKTDARALRTYTIWSVLAMFFVFSFVGWGWEVSIHLVKDGIFVNRGVMHGPWRQSTCSCRCLTLLCPSSK